MTQIWDSLAMGGYGAYVWPAYGLAGAVLCGLVVVGLRGLRAEERRLAALEASRSRGDRKVRKEAT